MVKGRFRRMLKGRGRRYYKSQPIKTYQIPTTYHTVIGTKVNIGRKPYFFKRTYRTSYAVTDTFTSRANAHMLANLPNQSEFVALFDSYKILAIRAKFIYNMNGAVGPATATNFLPELVTCNDYDDATPLASITDFEQYDSFKIKRLDRPITRYFKPKVAQPAYQAGAFNGYARPEKVPWLDCASNAIEHYGLKYAIRADTQGGVGMNTIGTIDIYWTYYIACRDVQ